MTVNPVALRGYHWSKPDVNKEFRHLQEAADLAQGPPQSKETTHLQKACEEFESFFIYFLMKTMRSAIPDSSFLGKGPGGEIYTALFDQELAKNLSQRGGIGISQVMMQELSGTNQIIKPLNEALHYLRKSSENKETPVQESSLPQTGAFIGKNINTALSSDKRLKETSENESTASCPNKGEWRMGEKTHRASKECPEYALPLSGKVTSLFGLRKDPFTKKEVFHAGIDLAMAAGSAVRAASPGKVIFSGRRNNYGNLVVLQHDSSYTTWYAHNSKNLVNTGDVVEAEQSIALVGDTGRTTGPHLHFELRKDGNPINPAEVLDLEI
jgi:murein DD-endopeptidase MepM/ murein hydrolase activator NlpD